MTIVSTFETVMQYNLFTEYNYKFFSIGSGSSGNCYYLGTKDYGILIDAGIGIRRIKKTLFEFGISFDKIMGVLVTHDHADHIRTIGCLGDKFNIPVYATQAVHDGIARNGYSKTNLQTCRRIIEKNQLFSVNKFEITPFEVPHDSIENVGYHIKLEDQSFVLITDIGHITPTIEQYARVANHLVIETNYDEDMLQQGRYPYYLKQRITSGNGHLSNRISAEFIANIYHERMKNIWLCHLSQDNNLPELAYRTVENALKQKGVTPGKDVRLETLSRYKASGLREF